MTKRSGSIELSMNLIVTLIFGAALLALFIIWLVMAFGRANFWSFWG